VSDDSRFKIGVITRQGGKSFGTSLEAVLDCAQRKTMWVMLSAGERQSKELVGKAKMHAQAISMAVKEHQTQFWSPSDKVHYLQLEIHFPNGSRIIGLPANPDTARGWSANILLDEFALHRDGKLIWAALFPTVTRGFKIRIISTFKGKSNKFYDMVYSSPTKQWFKGIEHEFIGDRGGWSKHFIDIHQAVEMGLVLKDDKGDLIEPEDLRLALNDDDAWEEEFLCVASDEASAFLSHDLISSVQDPRLVKLPEWAEQLVSNVADLYTEYRHTKQDPPVPGLDIKINGEIYAGMDIGRKKDLSVIWVDADIDSVLSTVAVIELKAQPYWIQQMVLYSILELPGCRRACIDETGIGSQLAERAIELYGQAKVEGIAFTAGNKEAIAVGLKENFDDRGSKIPADSVIRSSLHSVKKYPTTTKHFRFDAERTDETGHADHFWAKGLAVHARGGRAGGPVTYETVINRRSAKLREGAF
jgi:phage FluMu gp28-like protein